MFEGQPWRTPYLHSTQYRTSHPGPSLQTADPCLHSPPLMFCLNLGTPGWRAQFFPNQPIPTSFLPYGGFFLQPAETAAL